MGPGGSTGLRRTELVALLRSPPSEEQVAALAAVTSAADPVLRVRRAKTVGRRQLRVLGMGVLAGAALGVMKKVLEEAAASRNTCAHPPGPRSIRERSGPGDTAPHRSPARHRRTALIFDADQPSAAAIHSPVRSSPRLHTSRHRGLPGGADRRRVPTRVAVIVAGVRSASMSPPRKDAFQDLDVFLGKEVDT